VVRRYKTAEKGSSPTVDKDEERDFNYDALAYSAVMAVVKAKDWTTAAGGAGELAMVMADDTWSPIRNDRELADLVQEVV